jgi:hypothetical protein
MSPGPRNLGAPAPFNEKLNIPCLLHSIFVIIIIAIIIIAVIVGFYGCCQSNE